MTSRRTFLRTSGATVVSALLDNFVVHAAAGLRRVLLLTNGVNPRSASFYVAFEQRLREQGWVEGRTATVEFATPAPGRSLGDVAREAIERRPDVVVTVGPEEPIQAARAATTTIPIVMVAINYDPIAKGYVSSLARPGANVTGVFYRQLEVGAKQLELLTEALPKGTKVAIVWDHNSADQLPDVEAAARRLGVRIQKVELRPPYDFETAFTAARRGEANAALVLGSGIVFRDRRHVAQLALRHRLPCASTVAVASDSGLLLGFGPDLDALLRRAAEYVDRILRGASPGELPVEQPTNFELVINLKTARALGVTIPPSLLLRADRVLE